MRISDWSSDVCSSDLWIATAWPDLVARQRAGQRGEYLSVGGRAYRIDPVDPLAGSEWLAIADAQGHAAGVRILSAAPIDQAAVRSEEHTSELQSLMRISYAVLCLNRKI